MSKVDFPIPLAWYLCLCLVGTLSSWTALLSLPLADQFLALADQVVVMDGGVISAVGTYKVSYLSLCLVGLTATALLSQS